MSELERALRDIGESLEYPPTPALARAVGSRLGEAPRRPPRRARRALVLAFALLVLAVGTAFAVPESREEILDWLGLQGVTVERTETLPAVPDGADLSLGEPVTLEEAAREVEFRILVPGLLGKPDEVYVDQSTPGGRVSLVYRSDDGGIGLLATEFLGSSSPELIGKLVASGTLAEPVTVNGSAGIWIEGRPHLFFYRDATGNTRDDTLRLAGNTLLVAEGDVLVRLEANVQKLQALRLARSLAAG